MKIFKSGNIDPNALYKLETLHFSETIKKLLLIRLNHLLKIIDRNTSDTLEKFVVNLSKIHDIHLKKVKLEDYSLKIEPYFKKLTYLEKFPDLVNKTVNLFIQILDLDENVKIWTNGPIQTLTRNYFRSFLVPDYISLEALIATIDHKQAINIHKRYITDYYFTYEPRNKEFVDLQTNFDTAPEDDGSSPWEMYDVMLSESKYAYRNNNCLWIDSLTDFPDPEIKYQICCYGDYEKAQIRRNEHIILTMEHTIAQGDPYCSRTVHDTRGDWNLKHPDTKFWESMEDHFLSEE